jgi:hypothetical protein
MTEPNIWEVWLADVMFDDGSDMKKRPVIILGEHSSIITAIELTSRAPKYADEFLLSDWRRVGLKNQSTVKTENIVHLYPHSLIHKIGNLGMVDIRRTQDYLDRAETRRARRRQGCYIATAVYGSYDCPQVWVLRRYRDDKLAQTWFGRAFIRLYYLLSPIVVRWFGETKWFNRFWRSILDKIIRRLQV